MWKRILGALVIVAAMLTPSVLLAFTPCGYFEECPWGAHYFDTSPQNSDYAHWACKSCPMEDHYPVCHPVCNEQSPVPELKEHVEDMVAAAEKGDVGEVLRLAPTVSDNVMWNANRQAVQIRSCSQTSLIASLPVHDPTMIAMAQKLPSVHVAMASVVSPSQSARR